jgi:hypothetical protein
MSYGCKDRPDFRTVFPAQDGYYIDGTRENATRTPRMVAVPFRMTKDCVYTTSELGRTDPGCSGCKWRAE